jgi:hypothetical protein
MLFAVINRKTVLVDSLVNDAFADPEGGTLGCGSNNIQSEFTNISMNLISPDDFMVWIETLRKSKTAKTEAKTAEASLEEAAAAEAASGDAVAEAEEITADDIVS